MFKEKEKFAVGIENAVGIERLQSYASLKRQSRIRGNVLFYVTMLLIGSVLFNIMLLIWAFDLRDSAMFHMYKYHNKGDVVHYVQE